MHEINQSIAEAIKKRATSAALGTYVLFWVAFHWQGFYVTLFTDQDLIYKKFGMLKNEYVHQYFFGLHHWDDWAFYLGYIGPAVLTVIFIWFLPAWFLIHAYRQEQRYKNAKRRVRIEEELEVRDLEIGATVKEKEGISAEVELAEERKRAEESDPKILWQHEYEMFENNANFGRFREIIKSVYEHNGRIRHYTGGNSFEVSSNILALVDSLGLIELSSEGTITLTGKGKYFVGKFNGI